MSDPIQLILGDCLEVMPTLPADSVDAVVTDPPYGLGFMGKGWDNAARLASIPPSAVRDGKGLGGYPGGKGQAAVAFDGHAFQAWCEQWGREALRVTKPGGYLLAFGGTRTHHRLVCALEDAGWIIRDQLIWIYASGFPKGKANLKPAHEPIVLARKPGPLRPLAIDECRIGTDTERGARYNGEAPKGGGATVEFGARPEPWETPAGRWPSNVLLSDPELFDEIEPGYSRFFIVPKADRAERERGLADVEQVRANPYGEGREGVGKTGHYQPRANVHPTVKPIDLMRHLVRLVTPVGGLVLDPFLGSGTTALAASEEGFRCIGIEKEAEYLEIARGRLIGTPLGFSM